MRKLLFAIANGEAAFLDATMGAFIVTVLATVLREDIRWWYPISGVILGLVPDFDALYPVVRRISGGKKWEGNHHESFMHWPMRILPIVTLLAWLIGGTFWAVAVFLCVFWHYNHDAYMMGSDGITWLLRSRRAFWSERGLKDPSFMDHDKWIEERWLRPHPLCVTEVLIGSIALSLTGLLMGAPQHFLFLLIVIPLLGMAAVWWCNYTSACE